MFKKIKYFLVCTLVVLLVDNSIVYAEIVPEPLENNIVLEGIEMIDELIYKDFKMPLTVNGLYSDNTKKLISEGINWSSSNDTVATVDNNGIVTFTGKSGGVTITAEYNGFTDLISVAMDYTLLESIKINEELKYSTEPIELSLKLFYSDGTNRIIKEGVIWKSNNEDVAVINNGSLTFTGNNGIVKITAEFVGISASKEIVVNNPVIERISIGEITYSYKPINLEITCHYSDGSTKKISEGVAWTSSNSSVAAITPDNKLVFTSVDGSIEIEANYNGLSDKITINAQIQEIKVSESEINYNGLDNTELKITKVINGIEVDITKEVKMVTNNTNVVMIDENNNLIFKNEGTAIITITYNDYTRTVNVVVDKKTKEEVDEEIEELDEIVKDIQEGLDELEEIDELEKEAKEKQNQLKEIIYKIESMKQIKVTDEKIKELEKVKESINKLEEEINELNDNMYIKYIEIEGDFEYSEDDVDLDLKVYYLDGSRKTINRGAEWRSENKERATVDKYGRVSFTGEEGWVAIVAKYDGKRDKIKTKVEFEEEESTGKRYSAKEWERICEPINYPTRILQPGELIITSEQIESEESKKEYTNIKDINIKNIEIVGKLDPRLMYNAFNVDINYKNGSKKTIGINEVKWTSSNTKIATITEEGVIVFTGKAGHLKIIAEYKGHKHIIEDDIHSFDYYFK